MANKALNQVSQVQSTELANVKTFLAVMNNGEIKQMSKEDMSAVVGGLLGNPIAFKGDAGDVNETIKPGYYGVNATGADTTNTPYNLGTLIVLNGEKQYAGGGNPIVQILITHTAHEIYVRTRWISSWHSWRKLVLST